MFRIRPYIFETNSSSGDYYNEGPYDGTTTATADQQIHIQLKYPDSYTDDDIDAMTEKIVNAINDNPDIIAPVYNLGEPGYDDDEITWDYDEILLYMEATATIGWDGSYYPATRYEPEEYPDPVVEDTDEMPGRGVDFKGKEETKEELLKSLKNAGFTDVIKIVDIYGDEVDEDLYYDNID